MLQTDVMARVAEGHLLFVREGALLVQKLDTRTMLLAGEPVSIANEVSSFAAYGADILRGDFARHCPSCRSPVGRWAPSALAAESSRTLLDAGANHVASLLIDGRNYVSALLGMPRLPVPDPAYAAGVTPG